MTLPQLDLNSLIHIGPYLDIVMIEHCMLYYPGLTVACPLFQYTFYRSLNLGALGKYWRPYIEYFNAAFPKLHTFIDYHISQDWKKEIEKDTPVILEYHERTQSLLNPNNTQDESKRLLKIERQKERDRTLFKIWHKLEYPKETLATIS